MGPSLVGKTLGSYEILSLLGQGGMGEVYAAKDTRLGRTVALKILPPRMADVPERKARFEREAKAVAALNHPNIVTLHSVEEADGLQFLTMELVEGQPLGKLVPDHGLPPERLFELSIPIVDAVAAAHRKGIA
ncbi:MAG: serine/threonine protein kinase, partial [Candidatus Eisenbacteria bacterium]|nr:serine/threonine protein kinase [Candidatus Eisenbacteria bacterium]